MTIDSPVAVDAEALREEVKNKYRDVARHPYAKHHFHTGRYLAKHLGYDDDLVGSLPDVAVESFAGVANPFSLRPLSKGECVVDVGSGAGFDSFVAAHQVGSTGSVVGVDMTEEMLAKSRSTVAALGLPNVEFREGLAEKLPVGDGWADAAISNGVINLCADKRAVFSDIYRVLRRGGRLQFADIANGRPVPESALQNIDLWTAWIAGGLPCAAWQKMLEDIGFTDVQIGPPIDTFKGAGGEEKARRFDVYGYAFLAHKP